MWCDRKHGWNSGRASIFGKRGKEMSIFSWSKRYCCRFWFIVWLTHRRARFWCLGSEHLFVARNRMKNSSLQNSCTPLRILRVIRFEKVFMLFRLLKSRILIYRCLRFVGALWDKVSYTVLDDIAVCFKPYCFIFFVQYRPWKAFVIIGTYACQCLRLE